MRLYLLLCGIFLFRITPLKAPLLKSLLSVMRHGGPFKLCLCTDYFDISQPRQAFLPFAWALHVSRVLSRTLLLWLLRLGLLKEF